MKKLFFLLFPIVIALAGCTHEKFKPIGGKGGAATIVVYPRHHDVTITLDSMMVYIKYNTLDAPGDGKYDDSTNCSYANGLPSCSFSGLWNGDYYIYTKGYDYAIAARVRGGLSYTVKAQQSQNLTLPVGEESGF